MAGATPQPHMKPNGVFLAISGRLILENLVNKPEGREQILLHQEPLDQPCTHVSHKT